MALLNPDGESVSAPDAEWIRRAPNRAGVAGAHAPPPGLRSPAP
jgi:hypothetical protein